MKEKGKSRKKGDRWVGRGGGAGEDLRQKMLEELREGEETHEGREREFPEYRFMYPILNIQGK